MRRPPCAIRARAADPQGYRAIVKGIVARKKFFFAITTRWAGWRESCICRAIALPVLSLHLDRLKHHHTSGVHWRRFREAVDAIQGRSQGLGLNVNATIFDGHPTEDIAAFLDLTEELGVGSSISPALRL